MIRPEHALVIGVFAFYLYDAMISFYSDEILLEGAGSRWKLVARTGWLAFGRYLHLPNPLAPYRVVFKGPWSATDSRGIHDFARRRLSVFVRAVAPLQWISILLAAQLLLVLPLLVVLERRDLLVALAGTIYLSATLAAVAVFYRRRAYGLSRRACWSIAFDLVSCPPFAINVVRKVSLRRPAIDMCVLVAASGDGLRAQLLEAARDRAVLLDEPSEDAHAGTLREPTRHD